MGKDELKAWFIARATKPLPCFSNSSHRIPNSNSSHRKRYWKEAVTATIGSGIATVVAATIGGNSSATSITRLEKKNRVLQWVTERTPEEGRYGQDCNWHGGGSKWRNSDLMAENAAETVAKISTKLDEKLLS
ncbi:hypothetical protein DEO72_LG11g3009 [Vigna unguiculata]|uniref:Uncharacterized protein n=1 Tax=Vigna unguiculata TaxID=3917 RepID=A0A4D6NQU0_VIGUN|nr:hypothetical protein DEO72_LG11g3009 [Vigna unguiculata]